MKKIDGKLVSIGTIMLIVGLVICEALKAEENYVKNASFEEQGPNKRPTSWDQDNWNVAVFSDSTRASDGKKSIRITHETEVMYSRISQHFPVKPNQEYSLFFDVFVGDDFQGEARGLIFDATANSCKMSNYGETDVSKLVEVRDRCNKNVAVLMPIGAEPAKIFQEIGLKRGMNLQAAQWKMNTLMLSIGYPTNVKKRENLRKSVLKYQKLNLDVIPYFHSLEGGYYVQRKNPNLAAGVWVKGEKITLHSTESSFLANKRVIRTKLTDVKLRSSDGKTQYHLGKDYQVINGDIAHPYDQPNPKPFAVARVLGSSIPDGATVLASYDYVTRYCIAMRRMESMLPYCPVEPEVQELMGEFMKNLARDYPIPYINPAHCLAEFHSAESQLGTDSRVIKTGKRPIELLAEDVCFLDKAAKSGNPRVRILQWVGRLNEFCRVAGPKLPKDALINVWGYDTNWPAIYGKEAITYWSELGFETSVMPWDNLRNVRAWAQVVAEARKKGYPCLGMIDSCWAKRYGGIKETAIVSWKIPKKGERGFVLLKTPQKVRKISVDLPVKADEKLGKEI